MRHRLRYGGPWFSAASALPLEGGLVSSGRLGPLLATAARRPGGAVALLVLLLTTPSEPLYLSRSPAGEALRAYFSERSLGIFPRNRFCRGVLPLPADHSDYLRGRHRQALRTNLRRAAAEGIACETLSDHTRGLDKAMEAYRSWGGHDAERWRPVLEAPEVTLMLARCSLGRLQAITGVLIDDMAALIVFAVARRHEARWALHDHLVRTLIARRVSYLVAEGRGPFGALGFAPNLQHYQHLLGYQLRHLRPVSSRGMSPSSRIFHGLAMPGTR